MQRIGVVLVVLVCLAVSAVDIRVRSRSRLGASRVLPHQARLPQRPCDIPLGAVALALRGSHS